jgi:general L-amino acid transport system permease protein
MSEQIHQSYAPGTHPNWAPPVSTTGPLAWLRQNLFNGVWNTLLTIVTVLLLVMYIPPAMNWLVFESVLNADSRASCKEIASGACWAVIKVRFDQFVFYLYPDEERWRPILAFLMFFPALYPLLFDDAKGRDKLMIFSAYYPWIAYVLVYGGLDISAVENWVIFAGGGALFAGWSIYSNRGTAKPPLSQFGVKAGLYWFSAGLLTMLGGMVFVQVDTALMGGFLLTMLIGVPAILVSLPIGVCLALGRRSGLPVLTMLCTLFIEFIRGVPLITLLFVADTMLNYFLPTTVQFDKLLRVQIMATLFASAYIAEVVRGGLQAIPKGQYEAADAMGLKYWESMRLIILPQALKISIPGIVSVFIGLYKDTTLVSVIGMLDPLGVSKPILGDSAWNGLSVEIYVFLAVVYFISCFAMSRYSLYLEKKLDTGYGAEQKKDKNKTVPDKQAESVA